MLNTITRRRFLLSNKQTNLINKEPSKYEVGNLDGSNGTLTDALHRLRSIVYLPIKPNTNYNLSVGDGGRGIYNIAIRFYKSDLSIDSMFQGVVNFQGWAPLGAFKTNTTATYFKIVVGRTDNANITTGEAANLNYSLMEA